MKESSDTLIDCHVDYISTCCHEKNIIANIYIYKIDAFFLYIIKASITTKLNSGKTHVKPTVKLVTQLT